MAGRKPSPHGPSKTMRVFVKHWDRVKELIAELMAEEKGESR